MQLDGLGGVFTTAAAPPNGTLYDLVTAMPSADYSAIAVLKKVTANTTVACVAARITAADTYYAGGYSTSTGRYKLLKNVAGVFTDLSTTLATFNVGDQHQVRLELIGTTLNLYVDGTLTCTAVDASIAAAGAAGLVTFPSGAETTVTGMHLSQWQAVT